MLASTLRWMGARVFPITAAPAAGVATTAATAAWAKASTFSWPMRAYSRRSRARGGRPPHTIREVRRAMTWGAVHAISQTWIHGENHTGPVGGLRGLRFLGGMGPAYARGPADLCDPWPMTYAGEIAAYVARSAAPRPDLVRADPDAVLDALELLDGPRAADNRDRWVAWLPAFVEGTDHPRTADAPERGQVARPYR